MKNSWFSWWRTQCQFCKRARMIAIWLLIMIVADGLWFNLIIK